MEQGQTDNSTKEDLERNERNPVKPGNEDCKIKEEKTEKVKKIITSYDSDKRSSSIDITIKLEKGVDNGMLMYSSKQLNEIRESVASSQWPDFLDEGFKNARGHWDPDRWHQNRKKGSTPPPGEGEKTIDRRERDSGYASHSVSERTISKPLGVQDRSIASTGDLNRKKLADPKERLKAETEGIVLSPQRRSFITGCQITQSTSKDEDLVRTSHDKPNRQQERDGEGPNRERNRDAREGIRTERNVYDRGMDKDDTMPLSLRGEGRRREVGNDFEDRSRRVGSGRIPLNRLDRDRGLGEDYNNDRTRNDRLRDSNDRNNYIDNRERGPTERRGLSSNERQEVGKDDERDQLNNRSRFNFQRDRDLEEPREQRFRREMETNEDFNRNRGRDWNDSKFKEYDQKPDRGPLRQHNYQTTDRERRDDRTVESDRGTQRFKQGYSNEDNKFHYGNDNHYNQRYNTSTYGRNVRGGSRYPRRSETEEPEWMSESVQMGELMELRGFDDSPEKEGQPSKGKQTKIESSLRNEENSISASNKHIHVIEDQCTRRENKLEDKNFINMDDIFHLDSIPGLANILADDSIDPSSFGDNSDVGVISGNQNRNEQSFNHELKEGGSKFSQFFQHESLQSTELNQNSTSQIPPNIKNEDQTELDFEANSIGPTIRIPSPGNPNAYFAPISPAAKTTNVEQQDNVAASEKSLMEMLCANSRLNEGNYPGEEDVPPSLDQLRATKSVKSVKELEADIKQMVGISGQMNDSPVNQNDQILNPGAQDPGSQFTDKTIPTANTTISNNQGQTDDMSAFKKFAALMEGQNTDTDGSNVQMNYSEGNRISGNGTFERMPPVVIKPAPLPINPKSDEELLFHDRQNNRIGLQGTLHNSNEHPSQLPQPFIVNQNGPDANRGNPSHTPSLQHLPQPLPRLPHSIQTTVPMPDQGNLAMLQLISNAPFTPELLKLPEALALQKALSTEQLDPGVLLNQFIHGNLPPIRREILLNVLKVAQNQGRLGPVPTGRISPPDFHNLPQYAMGANADQPTNSNLNIHSSANQPDRISPSAAHSPVADPIQMLMQQGKNNQPQRLSPMLLGIGTQTGGKNTLSVSPVPSQQRVPSPQELVIHTQQIMQNALIKRKLEEQKENYRRRNDYQSSGSFRDRSNSDSKSANNPHGDSPLAFTPMSVMKKMAADRRDSDPKAMGNIPEFKLSQVSSDVSDSQIGPAGEIGRKVSTHGYTKSEEAVNLDKNVEQYEDAQRFGVFQEGRETHPFRSSPSPGNTSGNVPQMSQAVTSPGQLNPMHLQHAAAIQRAHLQNQWAINSSNNTRPPPWNMNPLEHHLMMQQQQFGGPLPPNLIGPASVVGNQFPPHQPNPAFPGFSQQQLPIPIPNANSRSQQFGIPPMNTHSTSPSYGAAPGNLAKFFSPEVLAQAQSGNAPSMPPLPTQKALTLEEIEHQAATLRI